MNEDELSLRWAPTLYRPVDVIDGETSGHDEDLPFQAQNEFWEDAVNQVSQDGPHTGVMVAFYPSAEHRQELAIDDGEPADDIHLTLVYLGEVGAELQPEDETRLIDTVTAWASGQDSLAATTNGHGIFTSGVEPVTFANVDSPGLPPARQALVEALDKAGLPPIKNHGYTPHMTLAYAEIRDVQVPDLDMLFDTVVVAFAGTKTPIPLGKAPVPQVAAITTTGIGNNYTWNGFTTTSGAANAWYTSPRPPVPSTDMIAAPVPAPASAEGAKAFVATINGHTLITGPATTIAAMKDPSLEDITDQHMLWMHGRFVGAEVPNRNGALWSAGDLEMAKGTVVNGPLNWLHDARHVIGTLAKADYVDPTRDTQTAIAGQQSPLIQPHITATAAVWKWIYPDEAYVIQQASDQEVCWFSMECISREVSCVGPDGCGNTTTYAAYMAGAACEHVRQRASVRRFINPVFLGGAVIVPPTRPGWAEADLRVMDTAHSFAEAAFEQAGRPDMNANQWEQMMGQLVRFAQR